MLKDGKPVCDGVNAQNLLACANENVTHIDNKGFVYCEFHGKRRKNYVPCRKLKPKELKQLTSTGSISRY